MRKHVFAVMIVISMFGGALAWPQDKVADTEKNPSDKTPAITPLRVQVIFSEYEGEKKISNLSYTLLVNADDKGPYASMRMGLRVPIETSSSAGAKQIQYQDVGTNLDGRADRIGDRFLLKLNVERSSVYVPGAAQKTASFEGNEISGMQPVVQQFRSQLNLLIRDGQTIQSTVATDPVTGHVLKVDVTLNVIK